MPGACRPDNGALANAGEDSASAELAKVAAIKRQGLSLDETMARRPTAEIDAKWGRFAVGPALFTKLVYAGV